MDSVTQRTNRVPDCLSGSTIVELPKGTRVFQPGDACKNFYFLLSGMIRVDLLSSTGRALMLYRFGEQETCIMTTSCLLGGNEYCAEAHTETDVKACVLPLGAFEERLARSSEFRTLVFESFAQRLAAMMVRIEEFAFVPLDARLARRVLDLESDSSGWIHTTHDQLAGDLGSAREVISRKLADWDKKGLVERARGAFRITHRTRLGQLADGGD